MDDDQGAQSSGSVVLTAENTGLAGSSNSMVGAARSWKAGIAGIAGIKWRRLGRQLSKGGPW